jgi:predicted membrane chloride channel (bestrophin family)
MAYLSKKELIKVTTMIDTVILPMILKRDLDYDKVVNGMVQRLHIDKENIENVLNSYIQDNKIQEVHTLTIPDEKIKDWLDLVREEEEDKEKAKEFLDKIEKEAIKKNE